MLKNILMIRSGEGHLLNKQKIKITRKFSELTTSQRLI